MKNDFFRMINENFVAYNEELNLMPQVREDLKEEIIDVVEEYEWDTADGNGVDAILDAWWENKGRPMTEMFGCHPNYVKGKFMIVLKDTSYIRGLDVDALCYFNNYVIKVLYNKYVKKFKDNERHYMDTEEIARTPFVYIDDYGYGEFTILKKDLDIVNNVGKIFDILERDIYDGLVTKEMVEKISKLDNTYHVHKGMKVTKYIGKMCRELGIDSDDRYNSEYPSLCDALNPKEFNRVSVLSWHPVDYLRMSMGNSWSSCHTINIHDGSDGFNGIHCGGTVSYMCDSVSVEFYTVSDLYNGTDYELQDKIERCMFHIDPERNYFIQARMYPQCNDNAAGIYKSVREVVQRIIAESWNIDNKWTLSVGNRKCSKLINSIGSHYTDYCYFSECNISYNKSVSDVKNKAKRITVGHKGICITCGRTHYNDDSIACDEHSSRYTCYACGCDINRDNVFYYEPNEEYYCFDCVTYCERCNEYHPNDFLEYVHEYGYVCEDCLDNSGSFFRCDRCGKIMHEDYSDYILTDDGSIYCDESCAERDGYRYVESVGEWYYEDDLQYCNECNQWVFEDEYDCEHDMCLSCAENIEDDVKEAV